MESHSGQGGASDEGGTRERKGSGGHTIVHQIVILNSEANFKFCECLGNLAPSCSNNMKIENFQTIAQLELIVHS